MKDNAKAELEAIVEMAMEWCKENGKDYVTVTVLNGHGMANIRPTDRDNKKVDVFMGGNK